MDLEKVFDEYYDKIYSFIYIRVRDINTAEDLTSDVFLKVVEKIKSYDTSKGAFSTWIFTIALNEVRSHFRKTSGFTETDYDFEEAESEQKNPEEQVLFKEDCKSLKDAINSLDTTSQNIILLKYYGDLSNKKIAELLNISETNVSTLLSRRIKSLKKFMENII